MRRRPALDPNDASTQVHLSLPGKQYDRLFRLAHSQRCTVPDLVRQVIAAELQKDRKT